MSYKLKNYDAKQYADLACYCNENNMRVEIVSAGVLAYGLEENEILVEGVPQIDPDYEAKKAEEEAKRIAGLTMTALDFVELLKKEGSLSYEQIQAYLDSNVALKMQLTFCQNVYCKVVCDLCPLTIGDFTLTEEVAINAFKLKNGEQGE